MVGDFQRCVGCMKEIGNYVICPYCNYKKDTIHFPEHLPPKTLLKERYIVGNVIDDGCQGITYIGFDNEIGQVINIKEYAPSKVCKRCENSLAVSVIPGCEAKYKTYMSDFIDLHKELAKMRTLNNIIHVYDVFEENNTAYAIYEHVHGITLKQFILENSGEISWEITRALINPLIKSLSILHSSNIIHRGISPDNMILTDKDEIKLTSFSISVTRVSNSELDSELFLGYSAPEQYSNNSHHGPWTDVYSLAAVMYKMLTGTMPPEASLRIMNDDFVAPKQLNPNIPDDISKVLVKALSVKKSERIQSMNEFLKEINKFQTNSDRVNVLSSDPKIDKIPPVEVKSRKYVLLSMGITIISLLVVLIVVFIILFGLPSFESNNSLNNINKSSSLIESSSKTSSSSSKSNSSSKTSSSSGDIIVVPNFVGQNINIIQNNQHYKKILTFEIVSEYNDNYKSQTVFHQSISSNQEVVSGTKITLKVSKGVRYPLVPDYYGVPENEYTSMLKNLGIKYTIQKENIPQLPSGYVVRTSIDVGEKIDLESKTTLIVYVTK